MSAAVQPHAAADYTETPFLVRSAVKLGLLESVVVFLFALVSRRLEGTPELALETITLVIGLAAVTVLPGYWTRARTIEGIAGAAGVGLGAAVVFLLVDVALLQPLGTYTFRWLAIGGGSNWWYHPVWWMAGTFIPWMGAWIQANQTAKNGEPSVPFLLVLVAVLAVVCAIAAVVLHFPGAGWNLPTFGVAYLPGLALGTLISSLGSKRA